MSSAYTTTIPSSVAILPFDEAAMLPRPGDNAAVAKSLLPSGTRIRLPHSMQQQSSNKQFVTLSAPCLEGYRFAVHSIADGEEVLSWGLPFGHARGNIKPGDVLLNVKAADALRGRLSGPHGDEGKAIRSLLDGQPVNFVDLDVSPDSPFVLDERGFTVVGMNCRDGGNCQEEEEKEEGTFLGYRRSSERGCGSRNHVAVIALTASAAPIVAPLRCRWSKYEKDGNENASNFFDGVKIVAHTEGESTTNQHNANLIHRCIAGFLCHPNLGGAVVVTTGKMPTLGLGLGTLLKP